MDESKGSRDRVLTRLVQGRLEEEGLLDGAAIAFHVRGGVVHLRGIVPDAAVQQAMRRALALLRGVHAVWDVLTVEGEDAPRVLDLGCGRNKQWPGAVGVDRHAYPGVDLVADLEQPLPLATASVDHIFAVHFLEHVRDLLPLMSELHRVLKPRGVLHVMVPHRNSVNAWADPTHVRYFDPQTFKFFCRPHPGAGQFFPLNIACSACDIFADLQPVSTVQPAASEDELAFFFDGCS